VDFPGGGFISVREPTILPLALIASSWARYIFFRTSGRKAEPAATATRAGISHIRADGDFFAATGVEEVAAGLELAE
jgi:hypothetical protein